MKCWLIVGLLATACTDKPSRVSTSSNYDNPGRRAELFEATLRAMDEHPEYVDEMYRLTLRHPSTLRRMFEVASRSFTDEDIARVSASALVGQPRGLERVMIETLDRAKDNAAAERAIVDAIQQRSDLVADMLVERPSDLSSIAKPILQKAWADPETKRLMENLLQQVIDPKAAARNSWRPKR